MYSKNHRKATLESLAQSFVEALHRSIAPLSISSSQATPGPPDVDLSQGNLKKLLLKIDLA